MIAQLDKYIFFKRPRMFVNRLLIYTFFEGRPLTTKGRWVNRLVFRVIDMCKHSSVPRKEVKSPIFIVGTGRSGTTILGAVLSIHSDIAFLNEPKAIWFAEHSSDDLVGSYSASGGSYRIDCNDALTSDYTVKGAYGVILKLTNTKRIVDKYPELVFRLNYVSSLFPDGKYLAIIRCGVDTCLSVEEWSKRKGAARGDDYESWWGKNDRKWKILLRELIPEHNDLGSQKHLLNDLVTDIDKAAVEWIVTMREIYKTMWFEDNTCIIRHETLCAEPAKTIDSVMDYCGVSRDATVCEYANKIITEGRKYGDIYLHEGLVGPFVETLENMGYPESVNRVHAR